MNTLEKQMENSAYKDHDLALQANCVDLETAKSIAEEYAKRAFKAGQSVETSMAPEAFSDNEFNEWHENNIDEN